MRMRARSPFAVAAMSAWRPGDGQSAWRSAWMRTAVQRQKRGAGSGRSGCEVDEAVAPGGKCAGVAVEGFEQQRYDKFGEDPAAG